MKFKWGRWVLLSVLALSFVACGFKNFHDSQEFSNGAAEPRLGTESKITNSIPSTPGSFISNNTVAIVSNFNEKTFEYFGFCSGVRLSPYLVLTAAHCVTNLEKMRVVIGKNIQHSIRSHQSTFEISEVKIHDYFKNSELASERRFYDIALIKLKYPLPDFGDKYSLITQFDSPQTTSQFLHREQQGDTDIQSKLNTLIAGYGVSFRTDNSSDKTRTIGTLNEALVALRDYDYSRKIILLGSNSLSQACVGDSGGPLYIWRENRYYVQAIAISIKHTSHTDHFANTFCEKETSYLNLDHFKGWISQSIYLMVNSN